MSTDEAVSVASAKGRGGRPATGSGGGLGDLVAALTEAVRQSSKAPPVVPGPTQRVKDVAAAIKAGKTVSAAMLGAGYGRLYVAGHAQSFVQLLVREKQLTVREASRATIGSVPQSSRAAALAARRAAAAVAESDADDGEDEDVDADEDLEG